MTYLPTIGLEVHAELKTKTKMFCDSANDPEEKNPNTNICPVCVGYPGTLPVINRNAVLYVLRVGRALRGECADFSEFDRKNYFYPDLPKGYQISQYKYPLVSGGILAGVSVTRVHLEEDTARSSHERDGYSLVDFNRAGVPLMELVTEPCIHNSEEAQFFAEELQLLLRALGVSDANMDKGEMRVEANISVSNVPNKLGTKVEVKNLNSFKSVARAIDYEIARQCAVLEDGETLVQETRGWDEAKQKTFSQRLKESSHDYRYFPEPDLPKLKISEFPEFANEELPELPWEKRKRLRGVYGLKEEDSEMYVKNSIFGNFFEKCIEDSHDKPHSVLLSNYLTSDVQGLMKVKGVSEIPTCFTPSSFSKLIGMIQEKKLSSRAGKDILSILFEKGGDPEIIANERGLLLKKDKESLLKTVQKILSENPKVVDDYMKGKESALKFLIGQGMKETRGSGDPAVLQELLVETLQKVKK